MSNFWPSDLDISDTQSPKEILKVAQQDWNTKSGGMMELVLQDTKSETGNFMIIAHAKHVASNRTVTLFSILHRLGKPYPVTIQQKHEKLPDVLKKSYYKSSSLSAIGDFARMKEPELILNEWVAETPAEFRTKLDKTFQLGTIKSSILNLMSDTSVRESEEELVEESEDDEKDD